MVTDIWKRAWEEYEINDQGQCQTHQEICSSVFQKISYSRITMVELVFSLKKITLITDKLKVRDEVENLGPQAKEKRVIEK